MQSLNTGNVLRRAPMVVFCLAVLVMVSATAWGGTEGKPIKIGAVLSLSGKASSVGKAEKNALEMVVEKTNKTGGIDERPLNLVVYDTKSQPMLADSEVQRLMGGGAVAITGPSTSEASLAVLQDALKGRIPLVSLASSAAITQPVSLRKWIFATRQTDASEVKAIYAYMRKHGIKRIGLMTFTDAFGSSGRRALMRLASDYGITIVSDQRYGAGDPDVFGHLLKTKITGVQAIVNWSTGPSQAVVTKIWRNLAPGIPVYQSDEWDNKKIIGIAGNEAEGVISPLGKLAVWRQIPSKDPQKQILGRFEREYRARYGRNPDTAAGAAYDAIEMIVEALRHVGPDRSAVRDYLETRIRHWPGIGGVFNMSPRNHCGLNSKGFEMVAVDQGRWKIIR